MIKLDNFLAAVDQRHNVFDTQIAAANCRRDYSSALAGYADLITSSYGERYDRKQRTFELDDIFENLMKMNVMWQGHPIAPRRTDKDDPNIIRYVATVPNKKTHKNEDGSKSVSINGTKQITKTKHLHAETMQIYNMPQTNILGIPAFALKGEYYRGQGKPYVTPNGYKYNNQGTFLRLRSMHRADKEMFIKAIGEDKAHFIFSEIDTREQYALANIAAISIDRAGDTALTAGLIRTDYELVDDIPACTRIVLVFLAKPLINSGLTNRNIIQSTLDFVGSVLSANDVIIPNNIEQRIFVPGGINGFNQTLAEAENRNGVALSRYEKTAAKKRAAAQAAEDYEREQIEKELKEREAELKRKEELRAQQREEKRQRDLAAKQASGQAASKGHDKKVQKTIETFVAGLIEAGITPSKETYSSILKDVEQSGKDDKNTRIVKEALETLLSMDTDAADQEVAELVAETAEDEE